MLPVDGHDAKHVPSRRQMCESVAPQTRAALSATASSTGWRLVGELEMTRKIPGGRRLLLERLLVSLKRRTFSIAITAWAAKVSRSVTCLPVNGRGSIRETLIARSADDVPEHRPRRAKSGTRPHDGSGRVLGILADIGDYE
jgi:hypothetical protein